MKQLLQHLNSRRRGRAGGGQPGGLWLVTFADLSTLILAFFVLLFSMSTVESGLIERISSSLSDNPEAKIRGLGRLDSKYEKLMQLMADSKKIEENQEQIKNLLFEPDVLPQAVDKGMITRNIAVLPREDGTGIVFSAESLFVRGGNALSLQGAALLDAISPLLSAVPYDIMINGHSDSAASFESRTEMYHNSGAGALAVTERLLAGQTGRGRFAAAGYGPDRPLRGLDFARSTAKPEAAATNITERRIEIIIKNKGSSHVSS